MTDFLLRLKCPMIVVCLLHAKVPVTSFHFLWGKLIVMYVPPTLPGVYTLCQPGGPPHNLASLSKEPGFTPVMESKTTHFIYTMETCSLEARLTI
jgi:hypothetical protein